MKAREETKENWAKMGYVTESQNQFALGGIFVLDQVIDELTFKVEEGESE